MFVEICSAPGCGDATTVAFKVVAATVRPSAGIPPGEIVIEDSEIHIGFCAVHDVAQMAPGLATAHLLRQRGSAPGSANTTIRYEDYDAANRTTMTDDAADRQIRS